MKTILGIDLGTTFSLVGVMQEGRPILIPDAAGDILIPSAVYVDSRGEVLSGRLALSRISLDPNGGARSFKRDMGTEAVYRLRNKDWRPEELSAAVLSGLKRQAEEWLGLEAHEAVISVPAYFGEVQRQATRTAAEIAGLEVVRLVNEPTAAAIAFGYSRLDEELRLAVLDLGGGTFDVTCLELSEGIIEIVASSGDTRLGGVDFDEALAALAAERLGAMGIELAADPIARDRLSRACEKAKKALSTEESAELILCDMPLKGGKRRDLEVRLSRAEADTAWLGLEERLQTPIRRCMLDASWKSEDVDEVLLVGGSSRLPLMARLAMSVFGKIPRRDVAPDEAVALGAVLTAGLMQNDSSLLDVVVTDIAPFSMGVSICQEYEDVVVNGLYSPVISRGTVIPCSRKEEYTPLRPSAEDMVISVYQGEHATVEKNERIGELRVPGIPVGEGAIRSVEVRFTYNLNGLLEVDATVAATGETKSVLVTRNCKGMSEAEIARSRDELQKLKTTPAEDLPNANVLARADLLYQESKGGRRESIKDAIASFLAILNEGDPERIRRGREELNGLLDGYSR